MSDEPDDRGEARIRASTHSCSVKADGIISAFAGDGGSVPARVVRAIIPVEPVPPRRRRVSKPITDRIDAQRIGAHCRVGGRGEGERPPHPAGRGGQGSSRCPALRDRSRAGLPCSASGRERLPREHLCQLRWPAGRKAPSRLGCRPHDPAPVARQTGRLDRACRFCPRLVRGFPEMSCKGMNGSITPSRWVRLGRDPCTKSVRNRDRSASRPAPRDGNGSLMCINEPGRRQFDGLAGIEGSGHEMSTRSRTTRFLALIAALLLTVMGALPAAAQTMEEAKAAYARGDHATAGQDH